MREYEMKIIRKVENKFIFIIHTQGFCIAGLSITILIKKTLIAFELMSTRILARQFYNPV